MAKVSWYSVSNPEHKRFPEWRRSFGVSDDNVVLVPAAMAGSDTELNVMLCAAAEGLVTAVHLDHHYVPSSWLKQEFPKHLELIEMIEARAQEVMVATELQ